MRKRLSPLVFGAVVGLCVLGLPGLAGSASADTPPTERSVADIIPVPVQADADPGANYTLTPDSVIRAEYQAQDVGNYLAGLLRPATGFPIPVVDRYDTAKPGITLELGDAPDRRVGDEGYQLQVARDGITVQADTTDGLFHGVQSLRQLFPAAINKTTVQHQDWVVAGGKVLDYPRFGRRGAMLDVARHFFTPDQVKRYIDQIAMYKVNTLHLHLTDDQGWRIEIKSWPKLAEIGGQTAVNGDPGGYYTQDQYTDIVNYAASRHITVVPEVDMPGHTNAAQASYGELNCDGKPVPPRTDIEVGYSSLCIGSPTTYKFVEDVIRELAALTPGPYLDIGGDEAKSTTPQDYNTFYQKVMPLLSQYDKKIQGWHNIVAAQPPTDAIPEYWDTANTNADVAAAAARGNKILMAPANKAYLDMKYTPDDPLGLHWAGYVEVKDSYDWDPATFLQCVSENQIAGVEAPIWSETLRTSADIEYQAFPRLAGLAEIGWSPQSTHNWDSYRDRLAKQGPIWAALGINFYRSPQVDWK
ncbi:beta-N-acetylhexosaminidase [Nocardia terpenica]|uniref:beta-N-acetylhexosaminidase n=1 Tax=Nocardia terpenica TaxID=455432 RepID=UPI0018949A6E|nr:beta-N-acetylhexosaminidase [Nocardia terpenica]MBF6061225.1 beta-N-acetylhexosaminidase [Nocardia terpenica]MBF6105546.1 beta-N-acetylhexosaminidase [Nocardia terpenica]MBF6112984.1 beta-N-acetylhexosaminidase [Nocardia terpenica]MBF6119114.1 beta-N-acetylhexosaminidase [Nocardia terpenica]MBF6152762.1 beta-N-acetylhexosaminidase [Nocardia terpenica]